MAGAAQVWAERLLAGVLGAVLHIPWCLTWKTPRCHVLFFFFFNLYLNRGSVVVVLGSDSSSASYLMHDLGQREGT